MDNSKKCPTCKETYFENYYPHCLCDTLADMIETKEAAFIRDLLNLAASWYPPRKISMEDCARELNDLVMRYKEEKEVK